MSKAFDPQTFIKNLPHSPGVYQMLNKLDQVIYVGKARDLQKRVASYFTRALEAKTQLMVSKIAKIETIITASEVEALLLESTLIKSLKPKYNILLRDDKSYPYLYLSTDQQFPRLDFYRGAKQGKGMYFGPYPSAGSVRENLALIQKLFKLRQCRDSFFANRSRPCLQYQIKRCTAPCVDLVSQEDYQQQVQHAILFLQGKNDIVIEELQLKMEGASAAQHYEQAAFYRDQVMQLRRLQQTQSVMGDKGNIDIVGAFAAVGQIAIAVLQIRGGRLLGKRVYYPVTPVDAKTSEAIAAFIPQYYLNPVRENDLPGRIVLSEALLERQWIEYALRDKLNKKIVISDKSLKKYQQWQKMAIINAMQALAQHQAEKTEVAAKLEALKEVLEFPNPIQRIECFDISHTGGEATVASCVVYGEEGAIRQEYRKYNIKDITPGDDYAAMHQALLRRYTRIKSENAVLPDLLLIDGGKGQLKKAAQVLEELQVSGVTLLAVAKGVTRKAGFETLWLLGREKPIKLAENNMALHLIQFIRDESHRFAITSHRAKRAKARNESLLEHIEGVGVKRRQNLLKHFGGLQELRRASVADIARVSGVSEALAQRVFDALRDK